MRTFSTGITADTSMFRVSPKSQVCGVLTHLQINGRRCTYDVADKRAAMDVVGTVDGAGCARVVLTIVRMGKNNGNIMQIYAVDLVEVKELITESDKYTMASHRFRPFSQDRDPGCRYW